jgi:hypothetical protein
MGQAETQEGVGTRGAHGGVRCARCGGLNPATAEWCGQCLDRFADRGAASDAVATPRRDRADEPSRPTSAHRGVVSVTDAGISWTCRLCETPNRLDAPRCRACGAPFAASLREPSPSRRARDPGAAALASLLWPGVGHALIGLWGHAIARAVTTLWVAAATLTFAVQQGFGAPATLVFAAVATALWAVTAHDAYREASGNTGAVLLTPRLFAFAVLALMALSVATVFASALGARG